MSLIALPVACRVDGKAMDGITSLLPDLQGGPLGLRLGPELSSNGDFVDPSVWTLAPMHTISGGSLNKTEGSSGNNTQPAGFLTPGVRYLLRFQVLTATGSDNRTRGRILGGVNVSGDFMGGAGLYAAILVCPAAPATMAISTVGGMAGSISHFSLREVL